MENSIHINISRLNSGDYLATSREFEGLHITGKNINEVFERIRSKINRIIFNSKI